MTEIPNAGAPMRTLVIAVVTFVWAASAITGLIVDRYTVLEIVTPAMMLVIGYLFGVKIVRPGKDNS